MIFSLIPDGLPIWAALAVIFASFFTAALTAAFGLGGGLALLAIMTALFPAAAVIPIHGVAQLGSNLSRFALQRRNVIWPIVLWFGLGGILGAGLGGRLAIELPASALRIGVALFILYAVWGPRPGGLAPGKKTFFTTGAAAAFLTMFFGATGPIAATMLSVTKLDRLQLTATHAGCMVTQHLLKILIFGLLGFAYHEWAAIIIAILMTGFAGSALGTQFLHKMPQQIFSNGFRFLLTAFAVYLLAASALAFRIN